MKKHTMLRSVCAASLAALLAACSTVDTAGNEAPPAPSASVADAEARLAAVARERAAIEARFLDRQIVCYDKFFVNRCLDEAKEQQRVALLAQRAIEIEAARYLRQAKVDERDRAIAAADAAFQEEEAKLAAEAPPARQPAAAKPPARSKTSAPRVRDGQRAQDNAARAEKEAAERAANVAAYEERRRKSEERQKEVARRVAEREAKAARAAEAQAQKKAQTAPATTE